MPERIRTTHSQFGFTLIELLVVMVIVSLTTSLLVTGLNTTWKNFDKLLASNLVNKSARIPASWFSQSIRAALLYHPENSVFEGDSSTLTFLTAGAPDSDNHAPVMITWQIDVQDGRFWLSFSTPMMADAISIDSFDARPQFEYRLGAQWVTEFKEQPGRLPEAVRITSSEGSWAFAAPQRPSRADVPPEMMLYGEYEF